MDHQSSLTSPSKKFTISFFISLTTYLIYLWFRGFGWDGDSIISASQFIKIINRDLYFSLIDGGAHPKVFTIFMFGFVYQIFNNFYFLSFTSIVLNAAMVGIIVKWIYKENGVALIALMGLLINIPWTKIVVNCDNTAFSIPFLIFGLYSVYRKRYFNAAAFLIISNFFRTGSEFVIFILIVLELFQGKGKNTVILFVALIITLIHSTWGYLLVYSSREIFWNNCWTFRVSPESIETYQYSLKAIMPYLKSIWLQFFTKYSILFLIPAIIGLYNIYKNKKNAGFLLLIPFDSLILPVSTFLYGTVLKIIETKHMGYTILLPILASFAINKSLIKKLPKKGLYYTWAIAIILILAFSAFTGNLKKGDYEAHINGTGSVGWTNLVEVKNELIERNLTNNINILTSYNNLTFTYLDLGRFANKIDVLKQAADFTNYNINTYDVIVVPNNWQINLSSYDLKQFDDQSLKYKYFIKINSNHNKLTI